MCCRLKGQQQAYVDLEDEFRAALRIEENRFREARIILHIVCLFLPYAPQY